MVAHGTNGGSSSAEHNVGSTTVLDILAVDDVLLVADVPDVKDVTSAVDTKTEEVIKVSVVLLGNNDSVIE